MKRLLLFALLGLNLPVVASDKQPTPKDNGLKARLWFFTAQYIWRDRQLKQRLPLADGFTLEQVRDTLEAAEHSEKSDNGLYALYKDVRTQVNKKRNSSPLDVGKEIIAQLKRRRENDPAHWKSVKLDSLNRQFKNLLSSSPIAAGAGPEPIRIITLVPKPMPVPPPPTIVPPPTTMEYMQRHPSLPLLLAGFIGSLFGSLATAFWLNHKTLQANAKMAASDNAEAQIKLADLEAKLHISEDKVKRIELDLEAAKRSKVFNNSEQQGVREKNEKSQSKPTLSAPAPALAIEPAITTRAHDQMPIGETIELTVPPSPVPVPFPPLTKQYAPVTESAFLEDRILQLDALGHLPIELTLDPARPEQARFTLNPRVDQKHIIGDDVDRLKEFFSFLRPEKITTLRAGTAGELKREIGGWRVVKKAGLELS